MGLINFSHFAVKYANMQSSMASQYHFNVSVPRNTLVKLQTHILCHVGLFMKYLQTIIYENILPIFFNFIDVHSKTKTIRNNDFNQQQLLIAALFENFVKYQFTFLSAMGLTFNDFNLKQNIFKPKQKMFVSFFSDRPKILKNWVTSFLIDIRSSIFEQNCSNINFQNGL